MNNHLVMELMNTKTENLMILVFIFIDAFGTNCFANDSASAFGAGRKKSALGPPRSSLLHEKNLIYYCSLYVV